MMCTARTVLIAGVALGVGFCLGWSARRQPAAPTTPVTSDLGQQPNWRMSVGAGVRIHIPAVSDSPIPIDFGK